MRNGWSFMRRLAPLIAALVAMPALAENEKVYEGTVGTSPIVMAIEYSGDDVVARYFYLRTRLNIDLQGKHAGGKLAIEADYIGDKFNLTGSGPNLSGTFVSAKGRSLPVTLRPARAPVGLPADLPADMDLYAKLQIAGLSLAPGAAQVINGKQIRWYREAVSGIRMFRLESGYPPAAMGVVNRGLNRTQWASVNNYLMCTDSDGEPGVDETVNTPWLGAHLMSYSVTTGWSCAGAAHPDFGTSGHSYDMTTGRELGLGEVLRIGKTQAPAEDSDAWASYSETVFAPGLVALLRRYHPKEMISPPEDAEDECDYTDPEVWHFPAWSLSDKGLWVSAFFARAMRACDSPDWAILPWSALAAKP